MIWNFCALPENSLTMHTNKIIGKLVRDKKKGEEIYPEDLASNYNSAYNEGTQFPLLSRNQKYMGMYNC